MKQYRHLRSMRTLVIRRGWPLVLIAIGIVLVIYRLPVQHWLAIHTGTDNEPGPFYGFFSGFGSDLGEYVIVAGVVGAYHKHNCHTDRCWRIGKYPIANGQYMVCRHHHRKITGHPNRLTLEFLRELHRCEDIFRPEKRLVRPLLSNVSEHPQPTTDDTT
jgi:hypothetical protein